MFDVNGKRTYIITFLKKDNNNLEKKDESRLIRISQFWEKDIV